MNAPEILVVPTGTANTASVLAALERVGARARTCDDPVVIERAPFVVLPGVGAFAAAVRGLDARGLRNGLRRRIEAGRPTLAICLGLQLLCSSSEESPGAPGLGLVPATVRRFDAELPVPQLGWNRVEPSESSELLEPGWAWFANSFHLGDVPPGWSAATSEYGGRFTSALEQGAVLACQFHPELSGSWGAALLRRWIDRGLEA